MRRGILIDEDHMNLGPDPDEDQRKKNGISHSKSYDRQLTTSKLMYDEGDQESINTLKGF